MNAARSIDLIAGFTLCFVLRILHVFSPRRFARVSAPAACPKRILVVKCFGFGSILQMVPMLTGLKESFPDARVTLLTFTQNVNVARLIPAIDDVAAIEFRKGLFVFLVQTLKAIATLRRARFDLIMDCEFFSYYVAVLMHLVRRPNTVTIGFFNNRRVRDWLFTHMIAIDQSHHISLLFFKMLTPLGVAPKYRPLHECAITTGEGAEARVRQLLAEITPGGADRRIVMNINASDLCPNRRWPMEYFARLVGMITQAAGYGEHARVLLIGGPEDAAYVSELVGRLAMPGVHSLAGQISIEELAVLLKEADLFIGNDSGPLHLAMACGLPTVSIFGPETPHLYGPQGGRHRVFYLERHCSPCLNLFYSKATNCTDNECIRSIVPEDVFAAVDEFLRAGSSARPGEE